MSYQLPAPVAADFTFDGEYQSPPPSAADFLFVPTAAPTVDVVIAGFLPALTFSAETKDPGYAWEVTLAGTLPPLSVSVAAGSKTITHLLFKDPAPASADLVFGGDQDVPAGEIQVHLTATLPALIATMGVVASVRAELVGVMPAMTIAASMAYKSNTARPTVGQRVAPWQVADKPNQPGVEAGHRDAAHGPAGWAAFWERATGAPAGIEHRLPDVLKAAPVDHLARFQDATGVHGGAHFLHQDATRAHARRDGVFQDGSKVRDSTDFRHQDGDRTKRPSRLVLWQDAQALRAIRGTDFQGATPSPHGWTSPFQDGVPPPPGLSLRPVDPPIPPGCYTPDPNLLFSWPWGNGSPHLVFQCGDYSPDPEPGETVVVPVRKVYIVINTATLRRVSDGAVVPTYSLRLALDFGSWTWGWSASIPGEARSLVESSGGPVELAAFINGTEYRVLAESISRDRTFGSARLAIGGRGKNAVLDAPWSPVRTFGNTSERTAQQLMADALQVNGVPIGWEIDFSLTDWLVPAGAWSHQGSYISALQRIAEAAGGYLQPHRTANTIRVLHKYPAAPWAWGSVVPDFVLPADVVTRESLAWTSKADYNRVFVSGESVGVLGQVTRAGTAGDQLAPMVTDALITQAAAARQRGLAILGDTGKQVGVGLRLPVLEETGVIEPGKFVRYEDDGLARLGLVRATSVEVNGAAQIWQTLEVETHGA